MALWLSSLVAVRGQDPLCHPTGGLGLCPHIPGSCSLGTPGRTSVWLLLHKCSDFVPGKLNSSSLEFHGGLHEALFVGDTSPMCSLFHGSGASLLLCESQGRFPWALQGGLYPLPLPGCGTSAWRDSPSPLNTSPQPFSPLPMQRRVL